MSDSRQATVSTRVHEDLRGQILEGKLEPGQALPAERQLAEEYGVNRHAVREALKRLEQAGLIRITHGGATRVLDWRDSGGLEVLLDLGAGSTDPPVEIIRSVLEMRASIGIDAARLCAERASLEDRERIGAVANLAADLAGSDGGEELDLAFAGLWLAIVAGSGNIGYRLALNSLLKAMLRFVDMALIIRPDDPELIHKLGSAIASGDPEGAVAAAGPMLRSDTERLVQSLQTD